MLSAMQDMNELQANAWIYWQAVENGEKGNWWGLMQVPFKDPLRLSGLHMHLSGLGPA